MDTLHSDENLEMDTSGHIWDKMSHLEENAKIDYANPLEKS